MRRNRAYFQCGTFRRTIFDVTTTARLEFLVEPFAIDAPGPHVNAAVEVASNAGLAPDMGPFASTASGELETVIAAVSELVRASFSNGATSVQLRIDTAEQSRKPGLHDALDRIVADVERDLGAPIGEMTRAEKQRAVARLEDQGAFLLRGSVEAIASLMGVSKVTLYAYINAVVAQ